MQNKNTFVDPICAMCRIASLRFKNVNTKIGIISNAINIQEPTNSQSLLRMYYGIGREDVYELHDIVIQLIKWFLQPYCKNNQAKDLSNKNTLDERFLNDINKMVSYMCKGLAKLQETYKFGNVVLTLQYYINILNAGLSGYFDDSMIPYNIRFNNVLDKNMKQKICDYWNYEKLHAICELYDNCFKELEKNTYIIDCYLLSIDSILSMYEKSFTIDYL